VKSDINDIKKNLLHVRYDPAKVTPEKMLKVIDDKEYDGKVVPEGGAP
jgi:hypothetical protein